MVAKPCTFPACPHPAKARGICNGHYQQWRSGKQLTPLLFRGTVEERFWLKVAKGPACWVWTAATNADGYGWFGSGERSVLAHRFAYEQLVGPIPEGRGLDHTCHNEACVNPAHLRPATAKQNGENRKGANPNNKSSRVRNVHRQHGKWAVRLRHNGQLIHYGSYPTIEEAQAVAEKKRAELFPFNNPKAAA